MCVLAAKTLLFGVLGPVMYVSQEDQRLHHDLRSRYDQQLFR